MHALTLRLPDDLHRVSAIAAATRGLSLHAFLLLAVRAQLLRDGQRSQVVTAALERLDK